MRQRGFPAGPTERALDVLWARFDRSWRRLLSPQLITELRLRASFEVETIDADDVENRVPRGTVPDCGACEDICCVGLENLVSLRLVDVAVLMDADRTDLMSRLKPRFPEDLVRRRPALHELLGSELWRTLPVLRQVGESRICAALTPELRCSLHPRWPTSCARFPYTMSAVRRVVSWGSRCASKTCSPRQAAASEAIFQASISAYNERVRDAVLLAHARSDLEAIGVGAWLVAEGEAVFEEPTSKRLPIRG